MRILKTETPSNYTQISQSPPSKIDPDKCREKATAIAETLIKPLNSIEHWNLETARQKTGLALSILQPIITTIDIAPEWMAIRTLQAAKADILFLFQKQEDNINFIKNICKIAMQELNTCSAELSNLTELSKSARDNIYACFLKVIEVIDKELDHLI